MHHVAPPPLTAASFPAEHLAFLIFTDQGWEAPVGADLETALPLLAVRHDPRTLPQVNALQAQGNPARVDSPASPSAILAALIPAQDGWTLPALRQQLSRFSRAEWETHGPTLLSALGTAAAQTLLIAHWETLWDREGHAAGQDHRAWLAATTALNGPHLRQWGRSLPNRDGCAAVQTALGLRPPAPAVMPDPWDLPKEYRIHALAQAVARRDLSTVRQFCRESLLTSPVDEMLAEYLSPLQCLWLCFQGYPEWPLPARSPQGWEPLPLAEQLALLPAPPQDWHQPLPTWILQTLAQALDDPADHPLLLNWLKPRGDQAWAAQIQLIQTLMCHNRPATETLLDSLAPPDPLLQVKALLDLSRSLSPGTPTALSLTPEVLETIRQHWVQANPEHRSLWLLRLLSAVPPQERLRLAQWLGWGERAQPERLALALSGLWAEVAPERLAPLWAEDLPEIGALHELRLQQGLLYAQPGLDRWIAEGLAAPWPGVRLWAMYAALKQGQSQHCPALIERLRTGHAHERLYAAQALQGLAGGEWRAALQAQYRCEPLDRVRQAIAAALGAVICREHPEVDQEDTLCL